MTFSAQEPSWARRMLEVYLDHRLDLVTRAKAARMAASFRELLQDVIARPSGPSVLELRLMSADEERSVVVTPNQTRAELPMERITTSFDRQ